MQEDIRDKELYRKELVNFDEVTSVVKDMKNTIDVKKVRDRQIVLKYFKRFANFVNIPSDVAAIQKQLVKWLLDNANTLIKTVRWNVVMPFEVLWISYSNEDNFYRVTWSNGETKDYLW